MEKINSLFIINDANRIYRGLAFEQVLYLENIEQKKNNSFDKDTTLCLWRSLPAVVIGRNQNPFVESNYPFLKKHNIDFARRDSGGGTVYQDSENMNFCFINRQHTPIEKNLEILQGALLSLGIDTSIDEKNNVRYEGKKISGSAYRYAGGVQLHHFTLLLNTNLDILYKSIHPEYGCIIESVGIDSHRTEVANLLVSTKTIEEAIIHICDIDEIVYVNNSDMDEYNAALFTQEETRLRSKEWLMNKTPTFSIKTNVLEDAFDVIVKKGIIVEIIREKNKACIFQGELDIFGDIFNENKNSDRDLQKIDSNTTICDIIYNIKKDIIGG